MWYFLILSFTLSSYVDSTSFDSLSSAAQPTVQKRSDENEPWKNPYLPNTIEPTHYDLHYAPDFYYNNTRSFGNVTINIDVLTRTKSFIVHSKNLEITDGRVFDRNGTDMRLSRFFYYPQNDYYVMLTEEPLQGKASLRLHFRGKITLVSANSVFKCTGVYNIPYTNSSGTASWLFTTDFGPNYARNAFPSFDEPGFKATFKITLQHWKAFTALSNMPMEKNVDDERHVHYTVFKLSPKMSSHQVAFALTDFQFKSKTVDGKKYRIWAAPDQMDNVDNAFNVMPSIQNYLSREVNISYPLEPLDRIAIPAQLTTCRGDGFDKESKLLIQLNNNEVLASDTSLTLTNNLFGNLVASRSWKDAWLNAGLTTYEEILTVTEVEQTFAYRDYVFGWSLETSILADSVNLDIPLIPNSESSNETRLLFDSELKLKGAEILRMVESFIGSEIFKRAITRYQSKNANDAAVTDDLWDAIQQEVGIRLDIKTIMKDWVEISGIPVIQIELLDGGSIKATQKQFLLDPITTPGPTKKWYVPLTCTCRTKDGNNIIWMNKTDAVFEISTGSSNDWIEFNIDRTGYYRVNYDQVLLAKIAKQLIKDHTVFSELSRSTFISDALALAKSNQVGYDAFLSLTKYASKEKGLVPWLHINNGITEIMSVHSANLFCCLKNYVYRLTKDLMEELQVKDDGNDTEKRLRPTIMSLACKSGHKGCRKNATQAFKAWIQNEETKADSVDYMREIYCIGITYSVDESEWKTTFERYKRATSEQERSDLLRALTCSKKATLLESLLDYTLESTTARNVTFEVARLIIINSLRSGIVWKWLKRKYSDIDKRWGKRYAGHILPIAVDGFYSSERYDEVKNFLTVYGDISAEDKETVQTVIKYQSEWTDVHFEKVVDWFDENSLD